MKKIIGIVLLLFCVTTFFYFKESEENKKNLIEISKNIQSQIKKSNRKEVSAFDLSKTNENNSSSKNNKQSGNNETYAEFVEAKEIFKQCEQKRLKLQKDWKQIQNDRQKDSRMSNYEVRIINQAFRDNHCDLAQMKLLKKKITKNVFKHLNNGNYLKAIKIETLVQKETSTISSINWEIFKDLSKQLKNNDLDERESKEIILNIVQLIETNTSWKMEPFELKMAISLMKNITDSRTASKGIRTELINLEKEVSDLMERFIADSNIQTKYIEKDKKKIIEYGQEPDLDRIIMRRGKIFSKNYLPIFKDMVNFQNNKLSKFVTRLKHLTL